jgi:histidine triad (HIT) family protein
MRRITSCILCKISQHQVGSFILYESEHVIAVLDLYPATKGHILVLPKDHIANIYDMPVDTGMEIMKAAILLSNAVKQRLHPDGLNLIQSNGTAGGQTIDHFHLHIVPRYQNDSVVLKFGHGSQPADSEELANIASLIRL